LRSTRSRRRPSSTEKRGGQRIADDPLCCVVLGTAKTLNDFKFLRRILIEAGFSSTCGG